MKWIVPIAMAWGQTLSLPAIWKEYRFYARTHDLVAGPDGWYGQSEEGVVYRIAAGLQAETLRRGGEWSRYIPAPEGKGWLAWTSVRPLFRRSSQGPVAWVRGAEERPLPGQNWKEAAFTPDGETVVLADGQNLYAYRWATRRLDTLTRLTGLRQAGTTDWLYEEEFGFTRAFEVAPSGRYVAYLTFDNERTPVYPLLFHKLAGPSLGYPEVKPLPYPRVDEPNPLVRLYLHDLETGRQEEVWADTTGGYLPWLSWSPMGDELYFVHLTRTQNRFTLYRYEPEKGKPTAFLSDSTRGFFSWDDRNLLVWRTDQPELFYLASGSAEPEIWRYDYKGRRLAVYRVPGLRRLVGYAAGRLFFLASGKTPLEQRVGYLDVNRRQPQPAWIGTTLPWAESEIAADLLYLRESGFLTPPRETILSARQPTQRLALPDLNKTLPIPAVQVRFVQFPGARQKKRWGYLLLPADFDSTRSYPVVLTFYGGPGSQQVREEFQNLAFFWQVYLTQRGYLVACADGTGTALYPEERFAIYRKLGLLEAEDLAAFVRWLRSRPYVGKVGAFGWSYGGYMALRLAYEAPEGLAAAVAVAPVTDWRLYDSAYTERFMGLASDNAAGYQETALPPADKTLRVPVLLIHGEADDNVHVEHAYQFIERVLRAQPEAPLEWRIFPNQNHGLGRYRYRVYWEMERFFERHLR